MQHALRRVPVQFLECARSVGFWKRWTRPKPARKPPVRATVGERQRRNYRAACEFGVTYRRGEGEERRCGLAADLSAGGLRLIGNEDLLQDTIVEMQFTLPNALVANVMVEKPLEPFREMTVRGRVTTAAFDLRRRKLVHGLEFVELDERTAEEIQRFIHVWQLQILRQRAAARGE